MICFAIRNTLQCFVMLHAPSEFTEMRSQLWNTGILCVLLLAPKHWPRYQLCVPFLYLFCVLCSVVVPIAWTIGVSSGRERLGALQMLGDTRPEAWRTSKNTNKSNKSLRIYKDLQSLNLLLYKVLHCEFEDSKGLYIHDMSFFGLGCSERQRSTREQSLCCHADIFW